MRDRSQSLTGDLIRSGVSGAAGYVAEPFGDGAVRPEMLFPAYVSGFNLAEAFYLATPFLSWQSVVVGDPLCAPFAARRPASDDATPPALDPATELPAYFAERGLKAASVGRPSAGAAGVAARRSPAGKEDEAGAREALDGRDSGAAAPARAPSACRDVRARTPSTTAPRSRYRAVLDQRPNDAIALNNLAYVIGVHKKDPEQALPYARRGHDLLKSVDSADTLGWLLYLTGDHTAAAALFSDIVRTSLTNPEILLHAATVFAAVGRPDAAARELARALTLDAQLETREDVKTLRARIARESTAGDTVPTTGAQVKRHAIVGLFVVLGLGTFPGAASADLLTFTGTGATPGSRQRLISPW